MSSQSSGLYASSEPMTRGPIPPRNGNGVSSGPANRFHDPYAVSRPNRSSGSPPPRNGNGVSSGPPNRFHNPRDYAPTTSISRAPISAGPIEAPKTSFHSRSSIYGEAPPSQSSFFSFGNIKKNLKKRKRGLKEQMEKLKHGLDNTYNQAIQVVDDAHGVFAQKLDDAASVTHGIVQKGRDVYEIATSGGRKKRNTMRKTKRTKRKAQRKTKRKVQRKTKRKVQRKTKRKVQRKTKRSRSRRR